MKKEQALDQVENLLDTLTNYKVISTEVSDALLEDLVLIIDRIDYLEPELPIWNNHPSAQSKKSKKKSSVQLWEELLEQHKKDFPEDNL